MWEKIEQVSLVDLVAIAFIGIGFLVGVWTGQENIALTCIGALGGYVGSVINNSGKAGKGE